MSRPGQHVWVEFASAPPPPGMIYGGLPVVEARCRQGCGWERRQSAAGGHTYRRVGDATWQPGTHGGRAPACDVKMTEVTR